MGLFEFLMVLVSIIVGLGIAKILGGVADTLRSRTSVRYYWPHAVLVLLLFAALLQQWWEIWSLRDAPEWSFVALLLLLGAPVCLFLMADLVFPEPTDGADFTDYYYREMRPLWLLGIATVVVSTLFRPIVFGQPLVDASNATSLVGLLGMGVLFGSSRHAVHALLVPTLLVLLMADILLWTPVIAL